MLPATSSAAAGSTMSQVPSGLSAWRMCRAAASGSPMSCRQSKVAARSYPVPEKVDAGDLEADPVGDALVTGVLAGRLDRPVVVVGPGEPGVRVLLGEQDGGRAEPAADVGHGRAGPQLVLHAVERRDPGRHEVGDVARPEELLAAGEDVLVLLVPAHPGTGPER